MNKMPKIKTIKGDVPVILVCPHGWKDDDTNTDALTETLANRIDAYAVINSEWRRGDNPDAKAGIANLNNREHVEKYVPEFAEAILKFREDILESFRAVHVFWIHGMVDMPGKKNSHDAVLGFGAGNPPSYTCSMEYKSELAYRMSQNGWSVAAGGPGGKYSARNKKNMTQYFKVKGLDRTNSVQIELANSLREPMAECKKTGHTLGNTLYNFIFKDVIVPKTFELKEI